LLRRATGAASCQYPRLEAYESGKGRDRLPRSHKHMGRARSASRRRRFNDSTHRLLSQTNKLMTDKNLFVLTNSFRYSNLHTDILSWALLVTRLNRRSPTRPASLVLVTASLTLVGTSSAGGSEPSSPTVPQREDTRGRSISACFSTATLHRSRRDTP